MRIVINTQRIIFNPLTRLSKVGVFSLFLLVSGCAWSTKQVNTEPSFHNSEIKQAYQKGEEALQQGDFSKARGVLSRTISSFPGEDDLSQIQWLIARTYEMEGRIEDAISEYKRFLRNYPDHPNAKDAEDRIRRMEQTDTLAIRSVKPKPVRVFGSLSTDYEYAVQTAPSDLTTMNQPSERIDVQVRNLSGGRGKVVMSGIKTFDLLDNTRDQTRIYKLYSQWQNLSESLGVQFGRQPSTAGGLWNRYDGLQFQYRPISSLGLELSSGFPVDFIAQDGIGTDKLFYETGLTFSSLQQSISRIYFITQYNEGIQEREAVGGNLQTTWMNLTLTGNIDYDLGFSDINDRFLSLDYRVSEPVHLNLSWDVRKDPYLQLGTSLQDSTAQTQGVTSLKDWVALQGESAVRSMAELNTIDSTDAHMGIQWNINPTWSTNLDYSHGISDSTDPQKGRVTRTSDRYSAYISEQNHWGFDEILSLLALHQNGSDLETDALYLTATKRFDGWMSFQVKGRVENNAFRIPGASDYIRYVPGLALNMELQRSLSLNVETEYSMEDHSDGSSLSSLWSRFNITSWF